MLIITHKRRQSIDCTLYYKSRFKNMFAKKKKSLWLYGSQASSRWKKAPFDGSSFFLKQESIYAVTQQNTSSFFVVQELVVSLYFHLWEKEKTEALEMCCIVQKGWSQGWRLKWNPTYRTNVAYSIAKNGYICGITALWLIYWL